MDLENENPNPPTLFDKPRAPASLKAATMACLVFLVVGLLVGGWIGRRLGPIRVVTKVVVEPAKKPPHSPKPTKATLPVSCMDALDMMQKLLTPVDQYTAASQGQRDIASDAYVAIATQDLKKLVEVQGRQNKLNNSLSSAGNDIGEYRNLLNSHLNKCRDELK